MEICPLCNSNAKLFFESKYFRCSNCNGIFVAKAYLPDSVAEKKRYNNHQNNVNDAGYRNFVSPIFNGVIKNYKPEHKGLDFGAGPGPVVASMLLEKGYQIALYDPFFQPDKTVLNTQYDYIVCCEVVEHFHRPGAEFSNLHKLLKPGGTLFIMTYLFEPGIDFATWPYRRDFTHVFFYTFETFQWIKNRYSFSDLHLSERLIYLKY